MTGYQPQTAYDTLARVLGGTDPWVAIGDPIDDWHRADEAGRNRMVAQALGPVQSDDHSRWAAFVAATVDQLAWESTSRIDLPAWVRDKAYVLPEPWFLLPGWKLRMHQLVDTPVAFKLRNIYGGDRIISRV